MTTKAEKELARERAAVLAEIKPADPALPFDMILLAVAESIVDYPEAFPVTMTYLEKHKPKRREWKKPQKENEK